MADAERTPTSPKSTSTTTEGESAFWTWILPVMSFLVGVALAGFLFFLFFDDDDEGDDTALLPDPTPTQTAGDDDEEQLVVTVPESCVEAAQAADTVAAALGDVARAIGDLDAREAQSTLDTVQRLRPEVERVSQECLEIAADAEIITPTPSASESESVEPTPSPTS